MTEEANIKITKKRSYVKSSKKKMVVKKIVSEEIKQQVYELYQLRSSKKTMMVETGLSLFLVNKILDSLEI